MLQRWDPFRDLRRMEEAMDRLWRGYAPAGNGPEMEAWAVPLDVVQEGDNVVVHASVPGVKPEDIHVAVEDGVLTISGETSAETEEKRDNYLMRERRFGKFHRALRLPETVDTEKAAPRYENGVLTVVFPKIEAKKSRRLEIKVK